MEDCNNCEYNKMHNGMDWCVIYDMPIAQIGTGSCHNFEPEDRDGVCEGDAEQVY